MKLKKYFGISVAAILIAFGIFIVWAIQPFPRSFDSQLWISSKDPNIRLAMVDDLRKSYKLIGMTRQQIYQLLGKPPGSETASCAVWDMGTKPGLDDCTFTVNFDGNGKVISVSDDER
jgi:hypothetical protein